MTEHAVTTPMVHYECLTCSMSATCVATSSSALAWHDHMAGHALVDNYRAWTWTAVQLALE